MKVTADRFREQLAIHIRARMTAESLSLQDVTSALGVGSRNWVFRAAVGDGDDERYEVGVPAPLLACLNWLELTPTDFSNGVAASQPGHVIHAILALDGIPPQQKRQLVDVVSAFLQGAVRI